MILTKENHDLRAANKRQKQKRTRSARRIASEQGLSVQQARELISRPNQASEAQTTIPIEAVQPASQPISQAPPKCTDEGEEAERGRDSY